MSEGNKILTPKQIIPKFLIVFVQVKPGNLSANSLSEIRQLIYHLYQAKGIIKKVSNNITKSIIQTITIIQ